MFLTTLVHDGEQWEVDLKVIPNEDRPGTLEFSFVAVDRGRHPHPVTWRISGDTLGALSRDGVDVSEHLLRRQLSRALAEGGVHGADGIPRHADPEEQMAEKVNG